MVLPVVHGLAVPVLYRQIAHSQVALVVVCLLLIADLLVQTYIVSLLSLYLANKQHYIYMSMALLDGKII